MARTSRRRSRQRNFAALPHDTTITVGALADDVVVKQDNNLTLTQDFFLKSIDIVTAWEDFVQGEGPLELGVCAEELTTGEVGEALDATPTSQYDIPAIEHARRPVQSKGMFVGNVEPVSLNDGRPIRAKIMQTVPAGKSLHVMWVRNKSGSTLTTGSTVQLSLKYYGNWK